jgi:hypothetical protein
MENTQRNIVKLTKILMEVNNILKKKVLNISAK